MTKVLFFRPNEDFAMRYASHWLRMGVEEARKSGYEVIDIVDSACTFETLKHTIETEKVDVAILGGHGNPNTFTGYNQQIVMQACTGDEVMSGTISHFLSCSVGQQLLPSIVQKNGIWTIGYAVDFEFIVDTSYPIEEDPYAEPFKDVTVTIIKAILTGATLKEAWDAGIAKCDEWIQKLWDLPETSWAEVISCLEHNRDGMIGLGDKEAYVKAPRKITLEMAPVLIGGLVVAYFALT